MSILKRLIQLLPSHQRDGIKRYYLTLRERKSFNVFVHRIHSSDDGGLLHNHPWLVSVSLVLQGGYVEEVLVEDERTQRHRKQFSLAVLTQDQFHRVVSSEHDTWTLFVTFGRTEHAWGFKNAMGYWLPNVQRES